MTQNAAPAAAAASESLSAYGYHRLTKAIQEVLGRQELVIRL